jgi:DMSO/TMAO reductase YedYZ molybdopterin-dependent catalytic subunit
MELTRRHFFLLSAAALLQPSASAPKRSDMLLRSARPLDLEMPLEGFADYITPLDRFFVRTHVYTPRVDIGQWRLTVDGHVAGNLTLTMDDLRRMPSVELVSVLECAGNGRGFYEPSMPGLQWGHGAVGNGRWRGVRLADVLKRAGLQSSPREVLFNGADVPIGTMPDFQRSIPIVKAMHPATLLAYEMNGETLPVEHGFPLRVVVPGWAGDSWIKWVTSITVLDRGHDGFWMARAYRHPGRAVQPGRSVPPEAMQPVTSLRVKSVISEPREVGGVMAVVAAVGKPITFRGAAWSGDAGPVRSVDISLDAGRTWTPTTMRRDQRTDFGWRLWEYHWTPQRQAYYTVYVRARDAAGNTQPLEQEWNPSGYGWNVAPRINVVVDTSVAGGPAGGFSSELTPPPSYKGSCLACHDEDVIQQQRLSRPQWDAEINKMVGWGAKVSDQDRGVLLDYLERRFGPRRR